MHSIRLIDLLVLGLSAFSVVEANLVDANLGGQKGVAILKRQEDTGSATAQSTGTSETSHSSSSSSSSSSSHSSTSSTPTAPTSTPPKTSPTPTQPPPSSSPPASNPTPPPSTPPPQDSSSVSESRSTITRIITTTDGNGAVTVITTQSTTTAIPGLANNGSGSSSSGMSVQTRNTVIGVVVGVGGAIILGALAFVAWRIWGRKRTPEENDGLMDYSSAAEKPDTSNSMSGRTPFQSTLESYHAPTQVNTASNF